MDSMKVISGNVTKGFTKERDGSSIVAVSRWRGRGPKQASIAVATRTSALGLTFPCEGFGFGVRVA